MPGRPDKAAATASAPSEGDGTAAAAPPPEPGRRSELDLSPASAAEEPDWGGAREYEYRAEGVEGGDAAK